VVKYLSSMRLWVPCPILPKVSKAPFLEVPPSLWEIEKHRTDMAYRQP
jgi:hypothetical protein